MGGHARRGTTIVAAIVSTWASVASGERAIPVRDLPPFPDVSTEEDKVLGATVVSATAAEEDVVVGASKREQSLGNVASAVTIISGDRLRRFGYRTLSEALASVVGVYIVDDRQVDRIGIRGVQLLGDANTRILILVDGSPINEPWSQYVDGGHALPVHLDDVARIEVIRGPVSSIYGTNAFLGIVNIVTLEADKAPRAYGRAGLGTFGSYSGNAGFGYGTLNRQVRGTVSFTNRGGETVDYTGFQGATTTPMATDADALRALNGSIVLHWDRLFFQLRAYDRTRQLPGAPYGSDFGSDRNESSDQQFLGELGYTRVLSKRFTLALRGYADRYAFENRLAYTDAMAGTIVEVLQGNSIWTGGEGRLLVDFLGDGKYGLTVGVASEWSLTDSKSFEDGETGAAVTDQAFNIQGGYLEASAQPITFAGVTPSITAGLRYDQNSLFESKLSPRAALLAHWKNRIGVKVLYTEGFRNPSIFEAYLEDRLYYPSLDAQGMSILRPEEISALELVLWAKPFAGLNVRVSRWTWDMTRIIEKRSVRDPMLNDRLQFQNVAAIASEGFELEASYRDTRGWMAFGNATWAKVERNEGFDPALNAPELTANVGVSTPLLFGALHVSTEASYVGSRHTRDDDVDTEPFLGWNATIYVPSFKGFDFVVGVRNLLGDREQIPAQADYDREMGLNDLDVLYTPGPGRELFTRLGFKY